MTTTPYLAVRDLTVAFGDVRAVSDLSYAVPLGRTLAIVGESGSGKSAAALAVMGLHDPATTRITGSVTVGGAEVVGMAPAELRALRGSRAAMVFQDPQSALHPYFTVGAQIAEAYRAHNAVSRRAARAHAADVLGRVGIPAARRRLDDYPHQFSGGMRQRVMIAMALVNDPKLLIADEPTTALDVTVQAQILDLIADLRREFGSAVVVITHDLGVVAEIADDVLVMYAGRCVERGPTRTVLGAPAHPYTWGLLESIPVVAEKPARLRPIPGSPPNPRTPPTGCAFHPRCRYPERVGDTACRDRMPELTGDGDRLSRCHLPRPDQVFRAEVLPLLGTGDQHVR
ncbi:MULTISPECIES: ABC transporter ATP-binding protein [Actinokineospora]|uniref:Dipeptide/oligopeptide/nickel ABC transporter ATP-binding protein n=1 Tax=Actinokineospora fastidiosa TaxID=1816 RepID=A0A918GRD1_9PSEU|nr:MULTISPECIES: ABC transporter ATP-binding protein [Actinokineospora]UVS79096.1 Stage 0 sporulation protein KD [Actinokineospora sp. UTMC 2448]GGS56532.1 dipeptide/oligopeptide/nickel ABC transporter ATP-binding protein [Actinokineospora fastidiosa]